MSLYQIPRSRVVYEVLNTEVIVIDFNTGIYFALLHVAKQVWQCLEQQMAVEKIVELIASHYQVERERVADDIGQFIQQLLKQGLIEVSEKVRGTADPVEIGKHPWEYQPPALQEYSDVQSLLLLDPIHEVTEVGWPNQQG